MNETSSVIRLYNESCGRTKLTRSKAPPNNNPCDFPIKCSGDFRTNALSMLVLNRQRRHPISVRKMVTFLNKLAVELNIDKRDFTVVFVTDSVIQDYNRDYRGLDKPTDVLSFPSDD